MKLPLLQDPPAYQGLYIVDFGDHTAVGYTAEEVAILLESERHRDLHLFRIVRAHPDGRIEMKGVTAETFQLEDGMLFFCRDADRARRDFESLRQLADTTAPPCRAKLHLSELPGADLPHVVALIFPAEFADDVAQWLLDHDVSAGERVEGGLSAVTGYYEDHRQRDTHQVWSRSETASRSREEVLAAVGDGVQR